MDGSTAGRLLVATPTLLDPNFYRTVLLMIEHDQEGAVGVVLNREVDHPAGEHVPEWVDHLAEPRHVFIGGPVAPEMAIGLAYRPTVEDPAWPSVLDGIGTIDISEPPGAISDVEELRVFAGYAGWGAGQLEFEIAAGSWFVLEARHDDVFTRDPAGLWRRVVRRQRSRVALYADHPFDPTTN